MLCVMRERNRALVIPSAEAPGKAIAIAPISLC
jgi:hypothetical protein